MGVSCLRSVTLLALILVLSILGTQAATDTCEASNDYVIENTYFNGEDEFTEGFMYDAETQKIYESTGLYGQSVIRRYSLNDDKKEVQDIEILYENPSQQFGEGLARIGDNYYQLTYKEGIINVFTSEALHQNGEPTLKAIPRDENCKVPEGWGLTTDGTYLYMSDGSNRIFKFSPKELLDYVAEEFDTDYSPDKCADSTKFAKIFYVTDPSTGNAMNQLNELEMVGTYIYANLWDPHGNGALIVKLRLEEDSLTATKTYNMCGLREISCDNIESVDSTCETINEFNGIAYDPTTSIFMLTGKNWPFIFKVTFSDNTSI